jgi:hypothetical protein
MDSREVDFGLGDMVYLRTDPDQYKRIVIAIQFDLDGGCNFLLASGNDKSWHFAGEISTQQNILAKMN